MIGSKVIDNVKSMTAAVDQLTKSIKSATDAWGKFGGAAGKASSVSGGFSSSFGTGGVGTSGRTMGLGTSNAVFGGLNMLGGAAQIGLGVAAGAYAAAPDLGITVARGAGYYGAARMGGMMNRAALQMSTMRSLRGGITSMGSDAAAAAMLVNGIGYMPGSTAYNLTMREIGGAARYLNMSNEAAAAAIGGFQTGQMGGNLYQYGIHTIDPRTGKQLSTGQIARQLYNRMFMGQKVSAKDVMGSLQYGFAGANLRNMGFSADQQEILRQAFVDISQGRNPDLAAKTGNQNPMAAQYQINTSQTNLMQRAEQPMLDGFQQAANVIQDLNKKMEGLPDMFFQLKGALQGFLNSDVGRGTALATTGGLAGLGNMATGALALYGGGKLLKSVGSKALSAAGKVAKFAGGKVLPVVGGALSSGSSKEWNWGDFGAAVGTSAAIGAALTPEAMGAGGLLSGGLTALGYAGKWAWNNVMGGGNAGFGASFGPAGGAFEVQAPVQGVSATTKFGEKNPNLWRAGHTGQDYPVPEGTTVYAAADGVVMGDNPGSAYGINIMIDHGNGYQTLYGHLSAKSVNVGDQVSRGQAIGKSGSTGNVTGPHLHFEVRKGKNNPVDPQEFLSGNVGSYGAAGSNNVISSIVGGATSIDLSAGYNLSSQLFGGAVGTTLRSSSPTTSGDSGSAAMVLGTGSQQDWASKFLNKLGVPVTSENLKAMTTWMAYEGGHWKNSAHYNPLNTTQGADGATSMNKVGVKSYTSWEQGMQATIDTIRNGRYGEVLQALQSGTDAGAVLAAVNHSPWGTKVPGYGGGNSGFGGSFPGGSGTTQNNVTIKVEIANASDSEAIKFAKQVKNYLDTGNEVFVMGSN